MATDDGGKAAPDWASVINAALGRLEQPPLERNEHFQRLDDAPGLQAIYELTKAGAAPLRFHLGNVELDVWIGLASEAYVAAPPLANETVDAMERLLSSEITIAESPRRIDVSARDDTGVVWLKSTYRSIGGDYHLRGDAGTYPAAFERR